MSYEVKVLADSISPRDDRLTTLEVTFPRFILAEFNTHRALSRNSASSRAIPVEKQLARVLDAPFVPSYWGANRPGMQATEELPLGEQENAISVWLEMRDIAVLGATALIGGPGELKDDVLKERIELLDERYGFGISRRSLVVPVHKQTSNRLLEPFMWHTVIVTATEWDNFFALRAHPDAQPEMMTTAMLMKTAYAASEPIEVAHGEYHLPLIQPDERDDSMPLEKQINVAVGRCARVSYLTHDGIRDPEKDVELYRSLARNGHMSPMEHAATPLDDASYKANVFSGNFRGWRQHRKDIPHEANFAEVLANDKG